MTPFLGSNLGLLLACAGMLAVVIVAADLYLIFRVRHWVKTSGTVRLVEAEGVSQRVKVYYSMNGEAFEVWSNVPQATSSTRYQIGDRVNLLCNSRKKGTAVIVDGESGYFGFLAWIRNTVLKRFVI